MRMMKQLHFKGGLYWNLIEKGAFYSSVTNRHILNTWLTCNFKGIITRNISYEEIFLVIKRFSNDGHGWGYGWTVAVFVCVKYISVFCEQGSVINLHFIIYCTQGQPHFILKKIFISCILSNFLLVIFL